MDNEMPNALPSYYVLNKDHEALATAGYVLVDMPNGRFVADDSVDLPRFWICKALGNAKVFRNYHTALSYKMKHDLYGFNIHRLHHAINETPEERK